MEARAALELLSNLSSMPLIFLAVKDPKIISYTNVQLLKLSINFDLNSYLFLKLTAQFDTVS